VAVRAGRGVPVSDLFQTTFWAICGNSFGPIRPKQTSNRNQRKNGSFLRNVQWVQYVQQGKSLLHRCAYDVSGSHYGAIKLDIKVGATRENILLDSLDSLDGGAENRRNQPFFPSNELVDPSNQRLFRPIDRAAKVLL
jgi:hypothetical protein